MSGELNGPPVGSWTVQPHGKLDGPTPWGVGRSNHAHGKLNGLVIGSWTAQPWEVGRSIHAIFKGAGHDVCTLCVLRVPCACVVMVAGVVVAQTMPWRQRFR